MKGDAGLNDAISDFNVASASDTPSIAVLADDAYVSSEVNGLSEPNPEIEDLTPSMAVDKSSTLVTADCASVAMAENGLDKGVDSFVLSDSYAVLILSISSAKPWAPVVSSSNTLPISLIDSMSVISEATVSASVVKTSDAWSSANNCNFRSESHTSGVTLTPYILAYLISSGKPIPQDGDTRHRFE